MIAKRLMVSFGLCGPVTQPTSAVPGGGPGAGAGIGAGPGGAAGGAGAAIAAASGIGGGGAGGTTPACCCTRADCGMNELRIDRDSLPRFGSGALRWPYGAVSDRRTADAGQIGRGRGIGCGGRLGLSRRAGAWFGKAGGATTTPKTSPTAAADATGIDAIRATATCTPFREQASQLTSRTS